MNDPDIEVPDNFKHLLKKPGMTRGRDEVESRKKMIVAYCLDVERSRESIEKYMGYKPNGAVAILKKLRDEHKLFVPQFGYYKAIVIDQAVADKHKREVNQQKLSEIRQLASDYLWEKGGDRETLVGFLGYLGSREDGDGVPQTR